MSRMVRKQLYITPEQDRKLKERAQRLRISEAEVVRYAIDREIEEQEATESEVERARGETREMFARLAELAKTTPQLDPDAPAGLDA